MIRNLAILVLVLGGAALYTIFSERAAPAKIERPLAPGFDFLTIAGESHKDEDFRGRPVVVNFWASWCAPCVIEFPAMLALAADKPDTTFIFLSFDSGDDAIKKFLGKMNKPVSANVLIGRDIGQAAARKFGTNKLPETYLVDREGRIARKIVGGDYPWDSAEARREIDKLR